MTESKPQSAIPDIITVIGSSLFQPIADHIDTLLAKPEPGPYPSGTSSAENGYAVAIVVLLSVVLESYVARLRFLRLADVQHGKPLPAQLAAFFSDLPNAAAIEDVYMVSKIVSHNHIWNLDVSDIEGQGAPTLMSPRDLKMATKQSYEQIVDIATRKTKLLGLNANPTALDRRDVGVIFNVIWSTLEFMRSKNYGHTPIHSHLIRFRGENWNFGDLRTFFPEPRTAV